MSGVPQQEHTATAVAADLTDADLTAYAQNHADELARLYMRETAALWQRVDRLSTWLTAAGGASIAVAISQLAIVHNYIGIIGGRTLVWALAISVLAGLIQKYLGFAIGISTAFATVHMKTKEEFARNNAAVIDQISPMGFDRKVEKYIAPLFAAYLKQIRPAVPRPFRFLLPLAFRSSLKSERRDDYSQLRRFIWQMFAVKVQFLALMVAVLIAAIAVRI